MRTLHHTWLCPFSRKVRLALTEKKLPFELVQHRVGEPSAELLALNATGQVPVLVDEGGTVVCESHAICEYLEELYPEHDLLGSSLTQRTEVRRLVGYFDSTFFNEVTRNLVVEKVLRRAGSSRGALVSSGPSSVAIREGHAAIHTHLEMIDWLNDRRRWLAGETFSLADCAAAGHLSALDYLGDVPWDKHPVAKEWFVRIKSRLSYRPLLQDRQPAVAPAPHYANLDF